MERGVYEIVDTESLVPTEHLLRKIDAAINWNKLYDMVEPLYCEDNGRPSIDPVCCSKWYSFSICMDCLLCAGQRKKYGQTSITAGFWATDCKKRHRISPQSVIISSIGSPLRL